MACFGKSRILESKKLFSIFIYWCVSFFYFASVEADQKLNPFLIDFPVKENLTVEDYIEAQRKLKAIDIDHIVRTLYSNAQGYWDIKLFFTSCFKGIRQTLIDPRNGFFPEVHFEKIGRGSEMCIVTCAPYNNTYPEMARSIREALKNTGFNGYFFCRIGGFPNPTGKEIQYAGVPYSFKIFMMMEAYKLGFNQILWIDSSMLPLRNLEPLFEIINRTGALAFGFKTPSLFSQLIFSETRQLLLDQTGTDVLNSNYLVTSAFGLKMNTDKAQKLIEEYYQLVHLGTPFLSCRPEEFVLTALLGKTDYESWRPHDYPKLMMDANGGVDSPLKIEQARKDGYFLYLRSHNNVHQGTPKQ